MLPPYSLVIIPTYNEISNIQKLVKTLKQLYPTLSILIIDDGSPDQTARVVKSLQLEDDCLFLIERREKLGLGSAYIEGMKWALGKKYEFIAQMDADFSHDPNDLGVLFQEADNTDLVIGSRYIDGIRVVNWPITRLLLSYFASAYVRFMTGMKILDSTGGFKCFKANTLRSIDFSNIESNGYSFQIEMNFKVWRKKMKIKEIPIIFYERTKGSSKMSKKIILEAIFIVFKLRLRRMRGEY